MKTLLFILSLSCFPAAFTSKATGNWSSGGQTTWNEVGIPGSGDTVSIGAHTITVDVNTTVGTSPNDATTKVIDITSASGKLIVGTGVTLTVLGNRGLVNGATIQQDAGSTVTFDNSASGGSPQYTDINGGFTNYLFNGTSGNVTTIQAISGQTFKFNTNTDTFTATYFVFRRTVPTVNIFIGNLSLSDGIIDESDELRLSTTVGTVDIIIDRVSFTNGTNSTQDVRITAENYTSGTRRIYRCNMVNPLNLSALSFVVDENYLGNATAFIAGTTFSHPPRLNFIRGDGTANGGDGMSWPGSASRNYFVIENSSGNPHFIAPTALLTTDNVIDQNIFESQTPDLIDIGDAILYNGTNMSGGHKVTSSNNIVLPSAASGNTASSGTLTTLFNASAATNTEWFRNTGNVNASSVGGVGNRGMIAFAEGGSGSADQISQLKSNVAWGSSSGQGYLGERVSGTTKDIITAANADYNWRYNSSTGDNQRGYEDKVGSGDLWTAGNAVAAGVDANQGTSNPQFVDSTRNSIAWVVARGYGSTFADVKAAIKADVTRTADLINYVFEGFKVANSSMRTSGYDGAAVGAANYAKPGRTTATASALKTAAAARYGVIF